MDIKIRDKRNKGWFYLDNEYLNGYARIFGAVGTAIYVSLCRHADAEQKCFPSQELIAEELNIAPRTVRKYLKQFQDYGLVHVERKKTKDGQWVNNTYYLLDKSQWKPQRHQLPMDSQRQITTEPEANNDSIQRHQLPTKNTNTKNTNKKNTKGKLIGAKAPTQTPLEYNKNFFSQGGEWIKTKKVQGDELLEIARWLVNEKNYDRIFARDQLIEFIDYWTALDPSGTRQLWQDSKNKYFKLRSRISTWMRQAKK